MTLVAGGVAFNHQKYQAGAIIMVCDQMLSGPGVSVHSPYTKISPVGPTWLLGYAGTPAHYAPIKNRLTKLSDKTANEVVALLVNAYQDYRRERAEEEILRPYGFTLDDFYSDGRSALGDNTYDQIVRQVRNHDLEIEFLLAGWSPNEPGDIKLVTVGHPGASYNHVATSVAAIGLGAPVALGHLYSFFDTLQELRHCQYRMLESKFMAEAERSVGPTTNLVTLTYDGQREWLLNPRCEEIRAMWRAHQLSIPAHAMEKLSVQGVSDNMKF